ncbi:MAG: hypothetical protein AUK33_02510 [Flavobacteriaceae bacterium CG2_30_34_30]|nr:hypothetical protein [Flavobacteriia bacterium]OIP51965.1 MAG: hypothetical protein AUK33_02510 [Flavobacteriaceae bacterium CG2_30_34_30]
MNVGQRIFNFYINSSIHVSLAVVSLLMITNYYLQISVDLSLIFFVFFGSITGYNFVKYLGISKLHRNHLTSSFKGIRIFTFVSFLLALYFLLKQPIQSIVVAFITGFLTVLYALPIFSKGKNLRNINGLKIFVIAFTWSLVTVILPVENAEIPLDFTVFILGFQRFLFVFVLMLPFEIRDLKFDALALGTIPRRIGVRNTKLVGFVVLFLIYLLEIFAIGTGFEKNLSMLSIAISIFLFLLFSTTNQNKYYASFWVEAIPIFWFVLLWGLSQLF